MFSFAKIFPVALTFAMSPSVYAEMESIADGELSSVTGQSGITIDYSSSMSLKEFRYENSGELVAENISSAGAGITDAGATAGYGQDFDNARLTFDVASDGGLDVLWQSQSDQAIDWGVRVGSVALGMGDSDPRTPVFSGLQAWGLLQTAQHSVLPANVSGLGRSASYNYLAFTLENLKTSETPGTIGISDGYVKSPNYMGETLGTMELDNQIPAWAESQRARSTTPIQDAGAGFAALEYSVFAVSAGEHGAVNDSLAIEVTGFAADIGAQNISVGSVPMGRMSLDNLQVSDTIITLQP